MLDDGALENVEAIFGLHISSNYPLGKIASRPGPILAASGYFEAVISGKGGHAAIPQHTIDPILAASNVVVSLQHLVSREADPLDSQVCNTHSRTKSVLSVVSSSIMLTHKLFREFLPSLALWSASFHPKFIFYVCQVYGGTIIFVSIETWRTTNLLLHVP